MEWASSSLAYLFTLRDSSQTAPRIYKTSQPGYSPPVILERFPDVQSLSTEEKQILAEELLDDLNAPILTPGQDEAILEVLNARFAAFQESPASASSSDEARNRPRKHTGAS